MADLSPESKEIYDLLMAETREAYEERFLAHKKRILDSLKSIESVNDALGSEIGDAHASIDPDDCDRKHDAYLALVNRKETASGSPPTNSTSSLHHRAPAAAVTAPSTTSSTASMSDPSGATSDPPDALSQGAGRYYDYLVGGSATPASATTDVYPNVLVSTELDVVHDAVEDLAVLKPSTCSTVCLAGDTSTTTTPSYQTVVPVSPESTPASPTTASPMLHFSTEIEDVQDAVDFGVAELAAPELSDNALLDLMGETAIVPPCLLAEGYKVFHEVPTATAIVPWPPPSWNPARAPLIRGHDLCHDAQLKRGKELLVSLDSLGNWNAIWLDVELKPPWPHLGVCMNLPMDVSMIHTIVSLAAWPMECSNSIVASGKRNDTKSDIAQPVLISSEYVELAIVSVPRLFMDIPFLISANVHQDFMGLYSMTALLSRLSILVAMKTEAMLCPNCQFGTGNTSLLLPWDPGLPLSGMDNKLSTIKYELVVRLLTASEVNYLQGCLMHSQLSGSIVIDTILKGVVALVQLHAQPSWGLSVWILPLANRATYTSVNWCYLNCTPGSSDLAIPHWVLVNFDSARVQFQCRPAVRKWIYHHILRGNTHCSEQMQWLFSHSLLQFRFCTAFVQPENFWKINLVPLKSWFQCCCDQRESIYGCENLQWTIVWSFSCPFSKSISCSFNCPQWEYVLLPSSTRRVSLSSSEKCQVKIARLLDLVLTEWELWPSVSASACGPVVPLFWWIQFANSSSFNFRDELLCNTTIQIQPWPSWESSSMVLQPTEIEECQPWPHPFGNECFQPTICHSRFSDGEVYSLVQVEKEGWFQFCLPGKASLYSYGTAEFQWAIAWPSITLAYSIHYGVHMYVALEYSIVICYLEIEIKCVPHMHWDPGGFSRHWLGVKTKFRKFAWFLVGSYLANSKSGSELVTLRESMPPLNQLMLNVYHTFSLGTPTEVGLLKDVLVQDWLICLNGHIIQCGFVVTQWKIAWSFFWEYYDFGDQSSLFIPAATLTYPVWYLSWDPGIWALLCFCGLFTQVVAKGGIMVEAPTYFYYHYSAVFLGQASSATTTSSTLCKSTSTTPATSVTVTTTARIMEESHVPWDPGGSTCHRLGVKPNFKEGGLSTTSLPGWLVGRHSWAKAGSEAHTRTEQMSIYTRRSTARRRGLERTDGRPRPGGRERVECVFFFL